MNQEELQYLQLLKDIIKKGSKREDRTGIGTLSLFGTQLRFSLEDNKIPMLTTKKIFARGAIEELLFFLRGETDTNKLAEKGVNIWKGNTSREFLDKKGLYHLPEGSMGKGYGYQYRYWNGDHKLYNDYYTPNNVGIDQIANVINSIKKDPYGRKHIVTAWNPSQLNEMALEPCHCFYQFYVDNGKLSLQWYQRSCDFFLGVPINILSYAILTKIIAKATNLTPKEIIFTGGDTHCYLNHIEQAKDQLDRDPYPFPTLYIDKKISTITDIENLSFEDFRIEDYQSHSTIKAPMAV